MDEPTTNTLQTTTKTPSYKDSPSGLSSAVFVIVVLGSYFGGHLGWPLFTAPHARTVGALGGVILLCVATCVVLYSRAVLRRHGKAAAAFCGVALAVLALIIAWYGVMIGKLYMCGAYGVRWAATSRVAFNTISDRVAKTGEIDGSIVLILSREQFIDDWYSDPMPQCSCRDLAVPMIGAIDLRDLYIGKASFDQAQAEFDRSGAASEPWERLGDLIFARDQRAWPFEGGLVIPIVLKIGCEPCPSFLMQFSDGHIDVLDPCYAPHRQQVLETCVNARKRGIPLLPADVLHDFKITEADIDAAASATKTMP
jgi:hypothetical protein